MNSCKFLILHTNDAISLSAFYLRYWENLKIDKSDRKIATPNIKMHENYNMGVLNVP